MRWQEPGYQCKHLCLSFIQKHRCSRFSALQNTMRILQSKSPVAPREVTPRVKSCRFSSHLSASVCSSLFAPCSGNSSSTTPPFESRLPFRDRRILTLPAMQQRPVTVQPVGILTVSSPCRAPSCCEH